MAWTQSDLTKIESAIATGTRRVTFRDRTVEYRSVDELKTVRDDIRRSLSGGKRRRRAFGVYTSKGL